MTIEKKTVNPPKLMPSPPAPIGWYCVSEENYADYSEARIWRIEAVQGEFMLMRRCHVDEDGNQAGEEPHCRWSPIEVWLGAPVWTDWEAMINAIRHGEELGTRGEV